MPSLCFVFQRGQMSTFIHSLRGQMSTPLYELGGKCPHLQFLGRGQMSVGANVRLPSISYDNGCHGNEFTQQCQSSHNLCYLHTMSIYGKSYDYLVFNPIVTNGLSHPYILDESTFIFRGIRGFLFHFSMEIMSAIVIMYRE